MIAQKRSIEDIKAEIIELLREAGLRGVTMDHIRAYYNHTMDGKAHLVTVEIEERRLA